jgi:hypothetical protein
MGERAEGHLAQSARCVHPFHLPALGGGPLAEPGEQVRRTDADLAGEDDAALVGEQLREALLLGLAADHEQRRSRRHGAHGLGAPQQGQGRARRRPIPLLVLGAMPQHPPESMRPRFGS